MSAPRVPQDVATTWSNKPEIPTSQELLGPPPRGLNPNQPYGKWESKLQYLQTHYDLLREDSLSPLRETIKLVKEHPTASEAELSPGGGVIGIYERVRIVGLTLTRKGPAFRVSFSLRRVGKNVAWPQSKRLIAGSLLAVTPSNDMFKTKALAVVVAARPLKLLSDNPLMIDLYFARPEEIEIDPAAEYVLVEDRSGYYEADRHTMKALQEIRFELPKTQMPFAAQILDKKPSPMTPKYLQDQPIRNLKAVSSDPYSCPPVVDIVRDWPSFVGSGMDTSQSEALRRILTKSVAIVQGPPGTGKTFVSVQALKVLLANKTASDPPIIVACHTNHALDQLLRHIARFEPDFVRLGGRSSDPNIKKRTLFQLRLEKQEAQKSQFNRVRPAGPRRGLRFAQMSEDEEDSDLFGDIPKTVITRSTKIMPRKELQTLQKAMTDMLAPLAEGQGPLDHGLLKEYGILSQQQSESLDALAQKWSTSDAFIYSSAIAIWLGKSLVPARQVQTLPVQFEYEPVELDTEKLGEREAETAALSEEEEIEALKGPYLAISDNWTTQGSSNDTLAKSILAKTQDLSKLVLPHRAVLYRYFFKEIKRCILEGIRGKAKVYAQLSLRFKHYYEEQDMHILAEHNLVGLTTTGLSKYRGVIRMLKPKVLLVEEAAETREAPVVAGCVASMQHLILVGDHEQLKPHCHDRGMEGHPAFLDLSLFERLVKNSVEHSMLRVQRRMIPEIRACVAPIYSGKLSDHASVSDPNIRPPVSGMGGVNSYFFTHDWPESKDEYMSTLNRMEADMVAAFARYLVVKGTPANGITVLTFYNGQRQIVNKRFAEYRKRNGIAVDLGQVKVVTVDSYQGEENEVIILSLVRNNDRGDIGFLSVKNRICVAISRAKRGFYCFGNKEMLTKKSEDWKQVLAALGGRTGDTLPIFCEEHKQTTDVADADDFDQLICEREEPANELIDLGDQFKGMRIANDDLIDLRDSMKGVSLLD